MHSEGEGRYGSSTQQDDSGASRMLPPSILPSSAPDGGGGSALGVGDGEYQNAQSLNHFGAFPIQLHFRD